MNVEHIKELSNILRDPSQWPEDFVWDFGTHKGCAMGLVAELCLGCEMATTRDMSTQLGIPYQLARNIFVYAQLTNPTEDERLNIEDRIITPEDIADLLDSLVEKV